MHVRVASTYGINPFQLSDLELKALDVCSGYSEALKEVFLRQCDSDLSPDRMYQLTLALTNDEEEALRRKAQRWLVITRQ